MNNITVNKRVIPISKFGYQMYYWAFNRENGVEIYYDEYFIQRKKLYSIKIRINNEYFD